jgi:alcohol dehydrogenase class IV
VVLPYAVAFNEEAIPEVMERIADALGAEGAATGLHDLAERIGAPTALKDIGMKEEDIDEAVGLILDAAPESNPRPVDEAGIRSILEDAYAGRRPEPVTERSI